jgi:hypothetical protein
MAKKPALTKEEIKATRVSLKEALKGVNDNHGKFVSDHKAAVKAHATLVKEQEKAATAAAKLASAAEAKLAKATAAAEKGRAKINAQLVELDTIVPAAATKAPKAAKAEATT